MRETWRAETGKALQDLVFSSRCLICREPAAELGRDICADCRSTWQVPAVAVMRHPDLFAVHPYDRVAQRIILAIKEEGRHALEPVLAEAMAIACLPLLAGRDAPVLLVPAPSRPSACRRRGADVVWSLARRSAAMLSGAGWPVHAARLLGHARVVSDQSGLDARARHRNISGSMRLRLPSRWSISGSSGAGHRPTAIMDSEIIVVDDLVTTGTTMQEAIRVLEALGTVLGGAAAASTSLPSLSLQARPTTGINRR